MKKQDRQAETPPRNDVGEARISGAIRADFLKVWEQIGHTPTLRDYKELGKYAQSVIKNHFGSFNHLIDIAITHCGKEVSLIKSSKTQEKEENFKAYLETELSPWVGKYEYTNNKSHKVLMVGADFHDEFVDPFCLSVFIETCAIRQPDYIVFAGDVMDFYELSYFNKNPARMYKLQSQIDFVTKNIFYPIRQCCPNAQIDYIIGNHEYRLMKYLMSNGQALSSLRCLSLPSLLGVDEYKINMVATPPFDQIGDELNRNYKLYDGIYLVTHGTATGPSHSMKELNRWRTSGCSAHVHHRQKAVTVPVLAQSMTHLESELDWISMGCMCKKTAGNEYIDGIVRWQQGFNIVHLFPEERKHINEYIEIKDGLAYVNGRLYKDKKD